MNIHLDEICYVSTNLKFSEEDDSDVRHLIPKHHTEIDIASRLKFSFMIN